MKQFFISFAAGIAAILVGWAISKLIKLYKSPSGEGKKLIRNKSDYFCGISLAVGCALLWSISFTSLSWVSPKTDALEMTVTVLGIASLFFFLALKVSNPIAKWLSIDSTTTGEIEFSVTAKRGWLLAIIVGNVGSFLLFAYALYLISASQTITLQKVNPIFVAFLGIFFLRKKITRSSWIAILLVVIGSALIALDLSSDVIKLKTGNHLIGSLLALFAGLCFAIFTVGIEKLEFHKFDFKSRLRFLTVVFFASYIIVLTVAYFLGHDPNYYHETILTLSLNGLRVVAVYLLFCGAVVRIGSLLTSVYVSLEVFLTMLWDYLWLGVGLPLALGMGAIIIFSSGVILIFETETK